MRKVGEKYGKTPSQLALNWIIMASPTVIPIPGAKSPEQVESNAGSIGWRLNFEDWLLIDQVSRSLRITRVTW